MSDSNKDFGSVDYGICTLSVIAVRKEPSDKSEITSQLLFGEHFVIKDKSEKKDWLYVEIFHDSYTGWIDAKQCKYISEKFFYLMNSMLWPVSKDIVGLMYGKTKVFPILYGSTLPFYNNGIIAIEDETFTFQGNVNYPSNKPDFKTFKNTACYYLSSPYLWGGKTHFGIDCSGFVQQVFMISGLKIPRDAYQQEKFGESISFKDLRPGDVAFFNDENQKVTHVGIILENMNIIHASGEVRVDKLDEKGIFVREINKYTHQLYSIKRYLKF